MDLISCRIKLTNLILLVAVLALCIAPVHEFVKIIYLCICILQQIQSFLKKEQNHEDHATANMFMMFILSHGIDEHFYSLDGKPIKIEEVTNYFDGKKCPHLIGKPKLFFVQACQGGRFSV